MSAYLSAARVIAVAGIAVAVGIAALRPIADARGSSSRSTVVGIAGGLGAILLAGYVAVTTPDLSEDAGTNTVAMLTNATQWVAATLWIGAVCHVAMTPADQRRRAVHRLLPWILGAAGVVAAVALVNLFWLRLGWGPVAIAQLAVVVGSVGVLGALPRRESRRLRIPIMAAAIIAGGGVVAIPLSPTPSPSGVPVLADVTLFGQPVPVLVAPGRPGWNLVHLGAEGLSAGTDPAHLVTATAQPGTRLGWVEVWLPPGRGTLWIGQLGTVTSLPVDTGPADRTGPILRGPDGPECASAALGRALAMVAAPLRSCPADRLSTADAAALRGMVQFLAERNERAIALVSDFSARGTIAANTIRVAARRAHIDIVEPGARRVPLIVSSGWAAADRAVHDVAEGRIPATGVYLAPWLLTAPLLSPPAGQLIPLRFAPDQSEALRYVTELFARFPGEAPSAGGFHEWSRTDQTIAGARLYAASQVYIPGMTEHAGHQHVGQWLPQGAIVPVSGLLQDVGTS